MAKIRTWKGVGNVLRGAKIQLEHMSWREVQDALATGTDRVIFGVGAVEQHGPHLPLLTDSFIAQTVTEFVARRLGRMLVAPTIATGVSPHHMAFPGTISLRRETLTAVIEDYITSLDAHGFKEILIIPIHGGDYPSVKQAVTSLHGKTRARVLAIADLKPVVDLMDKAITELGGDPAEGGIHAGEMETSLIWAIAPTLVDETRYVRGYTGDMNAALDLLYRDERGMLALTDTGIMGDPHGASAERGREYLKRMVQFYVDYFGPQLEG